MRNLIMRNQESKWQEDKSCWLLSEASELENFNVQNDVDLNAQKHQNAQLRIENATEKRAHWDVGNAIKIYFWLVIYMNACQSHQPIWKKSGKCSWNSYLWRKRWDGMRAKRKKAKKLVFFGRGSEWGNFDEGWEKTKLLGRCWDR